MKAAAAMLLTLAMLGGCAIRPTEIGREPQMSPVGAGLQTPRGPSLAMPVARPQLRTDRSLWLDSGADLFRDSRAANIGDVVTVKISIKDKASLDNNNSRSRDSKGGLNGSLKYGVDVGGIARSGTGSLDTSVAGSTSTDSKGAISRSESIELLVAAVVTDVLPNGNLVISGSQEVRVNFEVRVLSVAGVVRPRDVSTDNSVSYDKIAEARISYGGRGRITEVQQPGLAQQVIDVLAPY
jgi:flagellar L-ring protein precursor FlgH